MKRLKIVGLLDCALNNARELSKKSRGEKSTCGTDKLEEAHIYVDTWIIPQLEEAIKELNGGK